MKALFVVPCYFPATRYGGPIKSVHDLAVGLRAEGIDVRVFTTAADGPEDLRVPLGTPVEVDGVPVTYFPVTRPRSYFRSPRLRAALAAGVREYDVVYAAWMYVDTTISAAYECLRAGVPYVISPRGMLDREAVGRKGTIKKHAWLALLGKRAIGGAALVHFTAEGERENCAVRVPAERGVVIPNGLRFDSPRVPAAGPAPDAALPPGPVVLFLGRLSQIKGLDLLGAAWPDVVRREPSARLVLAGPDDEGLYAGLHRRWIDAGVASSTSYVGMADAAAKASWLDRCALLVSPSWLESFGMSIVEAMAAGKPVVVTDRVNIARDIERAAAGLVTPCVPAKLADAIVELLRDAGRARAMGARGRALVAERFSLPEVARRMGAALAQAAASRTRRT